MLTSKIAWSLIATYSGGRGLVSGSGSLSEGDSISLTDGTAAGQADGLFSAEPSLSAGDTHIYGLAAGLVDLYGATLEFSSIKVMLIEADLNNTADLLIGGGSWAGPFGDPISTLNIKPGCSFLMACQDANGWAVDPTADELQITCSAAALYGMALIGVSSALSAPAYTIKPAIVGSPTVGALTVCTDGDWSGSPRFTYKWTRAGVAIPGATGATYTPVAADVGKPLARVSYASNLAGFTSVATAPVIVVAAAAGAAVNGVVTNLAAGTTGQTLFT